MTTSKSLRGYWKQRIVMELSFELGSLRAAWMLFHATAWMIEDQKQKREPMMEYAMSDPGNYGIGFGNYTGD